MIVACVGFFTAIDIKVIRRADIIKEPHHAAALIPTGSKCLGLCKCLSVALNKHGRWHEIATSLGSDVPICLQSRPTRMLGVGDVLEPLTPCAPLHLVIATPRFGCATPAVYRAWDELDGPVSDRVIAAPTGWTAHCAEFRNDLEPAAIRVQPQLRAFRESFARIVHREPMLCGSGSSYCVWFDSRAEADAAADAVTQAGVDARMVCAASSR